MFDVNRVRADFPILEREIHGKPLVYLDNAATSQKPEAVIASMSDYYRRYNANIHRGVHTLAEEATAAYEQARRKVGRFINAYRPSEVIFVRNTTEAINLVAHSWGRKFVGPGDEVLLSEMEHHSNLIPWQLLAKQTGATLRFIPFSKSNGTLQIGHLENQINEKTRLISVTHMSNVFGTINPVRGLIQKAHERQIPVMLDGAQSVPHLPTDVQELDCDFLAFSGHKMCGPTGIGVLYGKEKFLEEMEPFQGGGEMIGSVWLEKATWNDLPHKFEAGTPNIAGAIGLGTAIDYLERIGMENITLYEQKLTTYALSKMREIADMRIFGLAPFRGGVISFYLGKIHPHDMAQFLDSRGIAVRAGHHCAQPLMRKLEIPATTRASFYFYNTFGEIDILIENLKKALEYFGYGT